MGESKIIIVDDHPLYRMGLMETLRLTGRCDVIAAVGSGQELRDTLNNAPLPDLLLLDIKLPDTTGIKITKMMKNEFPDVKILILSGEINSELIIEAVAAGCDGFISKMSNPDDLIAAIEAVLNNSVYFGKDIDKILYDIKNSAHIGDDIFTSREIEIIKLCGRGLMNKEIADLLNLSPRTIEVHKSHIFKKMGINNSLELVKYAIRQGLLNEE